MDPTQRPYQYQLPQRLLRAREAVMSYFRPVLSRHGLSEQQWRVLRLLAERGEMEAGEIAQRAGIHPPSLSGILTRMERDDLVYRHRARSDNRRLIVTPTPHAKTLTQRIIPLFNDCYRRIETHFSPAKLQALLALLDELENLPAP
ncbi:homoprotocatechuate degradation operon regulator HpaR [Chromobacterium haemolyticum]|uniref:homoprotocatechuate degradation operon regulator HpaR n=1 Tax=Chromobacterium haemolyticum TaxID=394935 RepID=UPI0009D95BA9|nr:homoprotocatechuate degradation operon regulator HpaR [Chromobacterium haemolyticum]OQS43028.1 homoprotocatechuate degradation operon regulator, HpaR [Chromobacterium haemolyticum]